MQVKYGFVERVSDRELSNEKSFGAFHGESDEWIVWAMAVRAATAQGSEDVNWVLRHPALTIRLTYDPSFRSYDVAFTIVTGDSMDTPPSARHKML